MSEAGENERELILIDFLGGVFLLCSPMNDVHDFVSLSATLEAVGTSAYTGITRSLSDPLHTLEAASILAIECVHLIFLLLK